MRRLAIVGLVLASTALRASDLPPTVSLEFRTATMEVVARDLAKALGVRIEVAEAVGRDVVAVDWKDAPTDEALARLASVLAAKWVEIEGGKRLVPDRETRDAESRAWRQERKDRIERGIAEWGPPKERPKNARIAPEVILPAEIARAIGADFLADLAPGARVVWSSAPTRRQRPLTPSMAKAVESFLRGARRQESEAPPSVEGHPPSYRAPDAATVLVDAYRSVDADSRPSVRIRLYDGQGKLSSANTITPFADVAAAKAVPPVECEDRIEASTGMRPLIDLVSSIDNSKVAGISRLPTEWRAKYSDVRAHDPLGWIAGDFYRQSAARLGRNLAVCLPDSLMDELESANERPTVAAFLARQGADGMEVTLAPGWLVAKPRRPACSRAERVDRRALAGLIAESAKNEIAPLDALADFAFATLGSPEDFKIICLLLFVPGSTPVFSSGSAMALYGSLGQAQRASLRATGALGVLALSPASRGVLETHVFGSGELEELGPENPDEITAPGSFTGIFSMTSRSAPNRLELEPTVALPDGLGPDAHLRLFGRSEPCFLALDAPFGALSVLSMDDLAVAAARAEDHDGAMLVDAFLGNLKRLRIGDSTLVRLRVVCAPGLGWQGDLSDARMRPDRTIYSVDNLPPGIAEEIKKRIEAAKAKEEPRVPPTSASAR